jgi:hypothetical protein
MRASWVQMRYALSSPQAIGNQRMALKKSDLYSSLWASCDELRGGMDASQYKDYVLFMLFIKYVSDKYGDSDDFAPPVTMQRATRVSLSPKGCTCTARAVEAL